MQRHHCPTCHWQQNMHCHVNPPSAQLIMVQGFGGQQPQPISFHPPVREDEFCSRHSRVEGGITIDLEG